MHNIVENDNGLAVHVDGAPKAEIGFSNYDEQSIIIDHTFVAEELRGQKVGEELVKRVVAIAREQGKTVVPACSYALAQFKRHEEYHDIWRKDA
ncbi:GNAT family N-acetyltransferase [Paenibacillus campi]|uniref:GNAT family N-acetyltransferase n=1 Tax=Paenibacillus campi TaxID=3106031 RepID=UPI002AFE1152|nr:MULTISPECIES: GNAT family N-acetyltransferase [unclassified Paenibacillus]